MSRIQQLDLIFTCVHSKIDRKRLAFSFHSPTKKRKQAQFIKFLSSLKETGKKKLKFKGTRLISPPYLNITAA